MILFYTIVFFGSLIGIATLFAIKILEITRHRVVVAPRRRLRFDLLASRIKERVLHSGEEIAKLWPVALLVARYLTHRAALRVAQFARCIERNAHKMADVVSHKHHFERVEPRSEYLKRVSERSAVRMMTSSR
jgi:hypothetical protein